ncbi:MAG: TIGR03905 family TSCPD domain-containing protein [Erysipelotrichaceae bacterium]|jgi:uncharacterized protein (TIGR03905 family)|nr:TIGR03905 family TSCPD domain-containing protein [Erysipelotrichaceae bacterium]
MSKFDYKPTGVCSSKFSFDIEDGIIKDVNIEQGCPGNLLGIKALILDKPVSEVIEKFEGIPCGRKSTSCPDQIARALKAYQAQNA